MKNLMKYTLAAFLLIFSARANSQAAFLDKPDEFDPAKPCKIMVNLKLTTNQWDIVNIATTEDMYLWIWKPKEHPAGQPLVNGLGSAAWKSSNPALKMTKEAEGIYSYTFTPTLFFETDAATIYKENFHFLVKPQDGGGYGDPDRKTEDLLIEVDPPAGPVVKIQSLPIGSGLKKDTIGTTTKDVFSIVYNNTAEEKATMRNAAELYVYPVATDSSGAIYKIASNPKRVADFPQLKMKQTTTGIFQYSCVPEKLFTLPAGKKIYSIDFMIVKPNLVDSNDAIDDKMQYFFNQGGCR
jgi:hypothetical protein